MQKLYDHFLLQAHSLPSNHIIISLLEPRNPNTQESHHLFLDKLTPRQRASTKGPLVDIDNRFNKVFPSFSPFNHEFSPGNRLIDVFPNHFSFHLSNRKSNHNIRSHLRYLDNTTIQASSDPQSVVVVSDASIKNQVATSISHIHSHNNPVIKTIHHVVKVTSIEAELFAIRCGIIQATHIPNINRIIVITDSIHTAKKIFDSSSHSYQLQSALISQELREFFKKGNKNLIEFWDCPSNQKWHLHGADKTLYKCSTINSRSKYLYRDLFY